MPVTLTITMQAVVVADIIVSNGRVYAIVVGADGTTYIVGTFTMVEPSTGSGVNRNNIAHILSNGTVDPLWNPNANSSVSPLAISGSTVYAGGNFTSINGMPLSYFARLSQ